MQNESFPKSVKGELSQREREMEWLAIKILLKE